MRNVRATITVRYYATLPDNDREVDAAFDRQCEAIETRLNGERFWPSGVTIVAESFSVKDGDTEPDE